MPVQCVDYSVRVSGRFGSAERTFVMDYKSYPDMPSNVANGTPILKVREFPDQEKCILFYVRPGTFVREFSFHSYAPEDGDVFGDLKRFVGQNKRDFLNPEFVDYLLDALKEVEKEAARHSRPNRAATA